VLVPVFLLVTLGYVLMLRRMGASGVDSGVAGEADQGVLSA
jgi:hypothetical protein